MIEYKIEWTYLQAKFNCDSMVAHIATKELHGLAWSGSIHEVGKFFKKFKQNKSLLYSCIVKFLERFYGTYLNYKRSDLDVSRSVKFNSFNY